MPPASEYSDAGGKMFRLSRHYLPARRQNTASISRHYGLALTDNIITYFSFFVYPCFIQRFLKKLDSKFGNLATERMPHFWEPGDWIGETDYAYIREFNMPKKTGFPSTMLDPERLICMFVQKAEKS